MQALEVKRIYPNVRGSLVAAAIVFFFDVVLFGSILMATLMCPAWILLSLVKSAAHRPGLGLALVRILIPLLTFGVVRANNTFQLKVAEANGQRIVTACEEYRAANGRFPKKLDDLVPTFLSSVPVAKYCLGTGSRFFYGAPANGNAMLAWEIVAPHFRKTYNFGTRSWGYVD